MNETNKSAINNKIPNKYKLLKLELGNILSNMNFILLPINIWNSPTIIEQINIKKRAFLGRSSKASLYIANSSLLEYVLKFSLIFGTNIIFKKFCSKSSTESVYSPIAGSMILRLFLSECRITTKW